METKPCPFCGKAPDMDAMDRIIVIECESCGYSRAFKGLLQVTDNGKPAGVHGEFYHENAKESAIEAWNRRAPIELPKADGHMHKDTLHDMKNGRRDLTARHPVRILSEWVEDTEHEKLYTESTIRTLLAKHGIDLV